MHRLKDLPIALDLLILKKVEKLAHVLQRLTGKTNFFFAFLSGVVVILAWLLEAVVNQEISFAEKALTIFIIVLAISFLHVFSIELEKIAMRQALKGYDNPSKIVLPAILFRMAIVVIYIMHLVVQAFRANALLVSFGMILHVYFLACCPLPPCQSKVMEWIKGLFSPKAETVSVGVKS